MKKINSQIREYLKYCEKVCGMTEATISSKKYIYHRFVKESGLADLRDLTNTVFNTWAAKETDRGIRPTTMNSYNAAILALVRYYNDIGEIIPLNVRLIHIVKQPRSERKVYTAQEIHQVIYLTSRSSRHRKVSLMIRIMFETGMRIAELSKLRVTDFNGRRIDFIGKIPMIFIESVAQGPVIGAGLQKDKGCKEKSKKFFHNFFILSFLYNKGQTI